MLRLTLCALLPLLARGQTAQTECPCASVSAQLPQEPAGCLSASCNSPLSKLNHGLGCVSATYGSDTCGAWDQSMPGCQGASPPSYCAQRWCYVDPAVCRSSSLRYEKSSYFPTLSPRLYYSYATCGGDYGAFSSFETLKAASNEHQLKVVLPSIAYFPWHSRPKSGRLCETPRPPALAVSEAPPPAGTSRSHAAQGHGRFHTARSHLSRIRTARYHYKRDQPGGDPLTSSAPFELTHYRDDSVRWEGILVEYFAKLASANFGGLGSPKWVLTWTSASSRAQHSSSWTAAVNDVALGIADIGCSLFWMTAERLGMATFTANLLSDQFYLFVPKPKVDDG